ncbi:MAG: tRNA pseudouridine(38-40) synthase TruA [Phycisphaerales bacterium]|nr:tRNA pseudouridine(38-40) synthase TruA [Phycisphaerales bacterium]
MPRYRLTIAYDGTGFCGWQKQEPPVGTDRGAAGGGAEGPAAAYGPDTPRLESERDGRVTLRTVQAVVERAVREACRERVELIGASRTDSGVHARGQVAAFTTIPDGKGTGWPGDRGGDRLAMAVNSRLPNDVVVVSAREVEPGFDPIAHAVKKLYSYTFCIGPVKPIWSLRTVAWLPRGTLDLQAMREAGAALVGEHDFAAFAAAGHGRFSTVRTVHALRLTESEGECGNHVVRMEIEGSGFLWNMVRIIAGTLMQVGLGQKPPGVANDALESRDRTRAGVTAPPQGLCLERVWYAAVE